MTELPDEQDMLTKEEIDVSVTPTHLPTSLWRRMWRASITAVAYLLLYTLSQVTVSLQSFYTKIYKSFLFFFLIMLFFSMLTTVLNMSIKV